MRCMKWESSAGAVCKKTGSSKSFAFYLKMRDLPSDRLKVFISYSWDDDQHIDWVLKLAKDLSEQFGIYIILDRYDLPAGGNLTYFMEQALLSANKVLMILTPNYKQGAEKRTNGVGYEFAMISQELFQNQTDNAKFIPVLRKGNSDESLPGYLKTLVYHSMMDDDSYSSNLFELTRVLYEKPLIQRPRLGDVPDLDKMKDEFDPVLEKATKIRGGWDLAAIKQAHLKTSKFAEDTLQNLELLFTKIQEKGDLSLKKTLKINVGFKKDVEGDIRYLAVNTQNLSLLFHYYPASLILLVSFWNTPPLPKRDFFPGYEPKLLSPDCLFLVDLDENLGVAWKDQDEKPVDNEFIANKFLSEFIDRMGQTIEN